MRVAARLREVLGEAPPGESAAVTLRRLVRFGLDRLPQPGRGDTLERWRALAAVAEHDLSLAKLYEGHTDALAILAELGDATPLDPASTLGVWAAEAPNGRAVVASTSETGEAVLEGAKCWCSGAVGASDALLTAWHADGRGPQLVRVALRQPGVRVEAGGWHAVGMPGSASLDVTFTRARGWLVGSVGQYLSRPGFWQGGAGIAACWYGGALAVAGTLASATAGAAPATPWRSAALGKVDVALRTTAALLREAAAWIDAHPRDDASAVALRVRLAAEHAATQVLDEVGRALGATPFCRDARFARVAADLPVFIRQSHAERDFAALGAQLAGPGANGNEGTPAGWSL